MLIFPVIWKAQTRQKCQDHCFFEIINSKVKLLKSSLRINVVNGFEDGRRHSFRLLLSCFVRHPVCKFLKAWDTCHLIYRISRHTLLRPFLKKNIEIFEKYDEYNFINFVHKSPESEAHRSSAQAALNYKTERVLARITLGLCLRVKLWTKNP